MSRQTKIFAGLVALVVALTLCGCAGNQKLAPTDASVNLGGAVKGAWGHTESAQYDTQQAMAGVSSETIKAFLNATLHELDAVLACLMDAGRALDDEIKANRTITTQNIQLTAENKRLDNCFVGPKTWRYIGWIVALSVVAWAAIGLSGALMAGLGGGGLAVWGLRLLRFIPFANPWSHMKERLIAGK